MLKRNLAAAAILAALNPFRSRLVAVNIAEGTHEDDITRLADAALTTRFLAVKVGTDAAHIAVPTAVTDVCIGVTSDEAAAAEDPVNVQLLGARCRTVKVTAGAVIAAGALVAPMVGGKVQTAVATQYPIGRALKAAAADGDVIEIDPVVPTQVLS